MNRLESRITFWRAEALLLSEIAREVRPHQGSDGASSESHGPPIRIALREPRLQAFIVKNQTTIAAVRRAARVAKETCSSGAAANSPMIL